MWEVVAMVLYPVDMGPVLGELPGLVGTEDISMWSKRINIINLYWDLYSLSKMK